MKNETILRWSAEDDVYIAEFPALPGCMADGANVAEALQNPDRIKQEWRETAEKKGRKGQAMSPRGRGIPSALNDSFNDTAFASCYDILRAAIILLRSLSAIILIGAYKTTGLAA